MTKPTTKPTTKPEPKRRIVKNVYGNWVGYVGNKREIEFGSDENGYSEREANEWLAGGSR